MRLCLSFTRARRCSISLLRVLVLMLMILDNGHSVHSTPTSKAKSHNGRLASHNKTHLPRAVDTSRKFACKEPQARAYNLRDLMQSLGLQNPGESANQPIYTVLKRCDVHSGCCMSPDMSCSPVPAATYFEDIEIEVWSLETNETRRQWIRVEQHGKCSCEVTNRSDRERLETQKPNVTVLR